MRLTYSLLILSLLIACNVFGQGGPPLVTDDPGTPGDSHWEINTAAQWAVSDKINVLQLPLFDINYGYGENIQLNLNTSLITANDSSSGTTSGLSVASAGIKWRFVEEEKYGVAVSTYPRASFHHLFSSSDSAINVPGTRYFLPIEFSKEFGRVGIDPEFGYATYTELSSEWVYGIALSYAFNKEKEVLFEIHGRSRIGSPDQEFLYNFGTRYSFIKRISILATLGRTIITYSDEALSLNAYLGLQIRI